MHTCCTCGFLPSEILSSWMIWNVSDQCRLTIGMQPQIWWLAPAERPDPTRETLGIFCSVLHLQSSLSLGKILRFQHSCVWQVFKIWLFSSQTSEFENIHFSIWEQITCAMIQTLLWSNFFKTFFYYYYCLLNAISTKTLFVSQVKSILFI